MILNKTDSKTIPTIISLMHDGKAAVIPCDTIYGLSSLYKVGEQTLIDLKGRDASKHFLILCTAEQAEDLCSSIPEEIKRLWPCPLTTILNLKEGGTIGIRVPDDPFLQELLKKLGKPIYSTSVNTSGKPSLLDFKAICDEFGNRVDLLIKGPENQGTTASTILDATQKPFRIIRQGSFDASSLISC